MISGKSIRAAAARLRRLLRMAFPNRHTRRYIKEIAASGRFDRDFYRSAYDSIHPIYRLAPIRHFATIGEALDFRPNPDFSPAAYLKLNPDVQGSGMRPFAHFVATGHAEGRLTKELPKAADLPSPKRRILRSDPKAQKSRFAVVAHIYYPDLWPEFAGILSSLKIDFDLFVTITYRGPETDRLVAEIETDFEGASIIPLVNKGRDILPFFTLVNAGLLDGYDAVCKIHTKKSPHREDGDIWRQHLVSGVLPAIGLGQRLTAFLADPDAAVWVADGQHFQGEKWWGSNSGKVEAVLNRLEIAIDRSNLQFPAGSIYWLKPLMISLLRSLKLEEGDFEPEEAQVDGTLAHAVERAIGYLAASAGQKVVQTAQVVTRPHSKPARPSFVSAFYLPQFHPIAENDRWWGKGFTEWRGAVRARAAFEGHLQPMLPSDLGYYDLRVTEVMGQQAQLARQAGIDSFCVYHYWFDGRRVLEQPIDRLLERPEIDFPFYLCWANESWRRNWDGLSGEILLPQSYAPGFEAKIAADAARYMSDPRYQRPDGRRPRFVIYRPEDMPNPTASVARLRAAWLDLGIGEVELGAVCFHIAGKTKIPEGTFDFWVEMPPHGMVGASDYLFGGPGGNRLGRNLRPDFKGLIYDYIRLIETSVDQHYRAKLPPNTICGAMPGWDNTARRGNHAHIAFGATPASFRRWLVALQRHRLPESYRRELFLNAWNEWAEKAVLEPSETFGCATLDVLRDVFGPSNAVDRPTLTSEPQEGRKTAWPK